MKQDLDSARQDVQPRWQAMADAIGMRDHTSTWALLCVELLLALSLSVSYYFVVRNYSMGVPGNAMNFNVFSACSEKRFSMDAPVILESWKGRLSGFLLCGYLFDDYALKDNAFYKDRYSTIFASYQAFWLFLLFLTVICALRNSLFVNLGIFAGLIYVSSPVAGPYFYPWDLPGALFFTLAILLYERRRLFLMSAAICAGYFFKETVLLCAILPFFSRHWKWRDKIIALLAVTFICLAGKGYLVSGLHLKSGMLAMANDPSGGLLNANYLKENLGKIFSLHLNHVAFANGGMLLAILFLCWQKRYLPYAVIIWLFVGAQLAFGLVNEFRIFLELLPLNWILLIDYWKRWERTAEGGRIANESGAAALRAGGKERASGPAEKKVSPVGKPVLSEPLWAFRDTGLALSVIATLLVVVPSGVAAWRYVAVAHSRDPDYQMRRVESLKNKAQSGASEAQFALANCYLKGQGVASDLGQAFEWFRKAAEQGQRGAQFELGMRYARGEGTPQNYAESASWLRKAAAQGSLEAQYNLGLLCQNGQGIKQDLAEAANWFLPAAKKGNVLAQYHLGETYAALQQYEKAYPWFQRAAETGMPEAQNAFGVLYQKGLGRPPPFGPDHVLAYKWFNRSAEQNYADAQYNLGIENLSQQNFAGAAEWFHKAAGQGHPGAQFYLGALSQNGVQGAPDFEQAAFWYLKSAQQGNVLAERSLGKMCHDGQGVKRDNVEAYKWFKLAQLQGDREAEKEASLCAASMTREEITAAENLVKQVLGQRKPAP